MTGNLTIDKASMNISYFLYSILIVANSGGKITRADFISEMSKFSGIAASIGEKENRTPYNKSKLPRYFGFLDLINEDKTSYLVLTNRGKTLTKYIEEDKNTVPDERYYLSSDGKKCFRDIIFDSVTFDSFGRNNCGAEQSNTDIEPPKILFKMMKKLGFITSEEFCYVTFGLNELLFDSYDQAIEKILENRKYGKYDYANEMASLNIINISKDCKLLNIFTNPNIALISSYKDDDIGKTIYRLSNNVTDKYLKIIDNISPFYSPLRMFIYSKNGHLQSWVFNTILGRVGDKSTIYQVKHNEKIFEIGEGDSPKMCDILEKSYANPKKNIYILLDLNTENELKDIFLNSLFINVLKDFKSVNNGCSIGKMENKGIYEFLINRFPFLKKRLEKNMIELPANVQIVGVIKNGR